MKKALIVLVVLLILAAAGAVGANYYLQKQANQAVETFIKGLPYLTASSHGEVNYSVLGKKLVIPDLKLKFKKEGEKDLNIQNVTVNDPPVTAILKVAQGQFGQEALKLAESVDVTGINLSDPVGAMTINRWSVTRPEAGPFPAGMPANELFSAKNLPKLLAAVKAAQVDVEGMAFTDKQKNRQIITMAKETAVDLQGSKMASVSMEGLVVLGDDKERVALGNLRIDKLDYTKAVEALAKGEPPDPMAGPPVTFDNVKISGIEVSSPKVDNVKIQEMTLSNFKQSGIFPTSLTYALKGMEFPVDKIEDKKARASFQGMGYTKLGISAGVDYAWDEAAKRIDLKKVSLGLADGGEIAVALSVDGADLKSVTGFPELMAMAGGLLLKKAEIKYTDASLISRIIKQVAQMQGLPPDQLKTVLSEQAKAFLTMVGDPQTGPALAAGVAAFIHEPKSLIINADPASPLPIMEAVMGGAQASPQALITDLNLSATLNGQAPVKINVDLAKLMGPPAGATPPDEEGDVVPKPEVKKPDKSKDKSKDKAKDKAKEKEKAQVKPPKPVEPPEEAQSGTDAIIKALPLQKLFKSGPSDTDDSGEVQAQPLNQ